MRYSYEFKRNCVELYRLGKWPKTPSGISERNFHIMIRRWVRLEDLNGPEVLKRNGSNKLWTPEEKLELISQVLAGKSCQEVALAAGIHPALLYQWLRKYKAMGYNGLINKRGDSLNKNPDMDKAKIQEPKRLSESEREELIRLRAENEYIKAENAVIKKEIALREEKHAALLKAKKQQLSKNSESKDIN